MAIPPGILPASGEWGELSSELTVSVGLAGDSRPGLGAGLSESEDESFLGVLGEPKIASMLNAPFVGIFEYFNVLSISILFKTFSRIFQLNTHFDCHTIVYFIAVQ